MDVTVFVGGGCTGSHMRDRLVWAGDGTTVVDSKVERLVSPGSTKRLTAAPDRLRDGAVRADVDSRARRRALAMLTPAAAAPGWASVIEEAIRGSQT